MQQVFIVLETKTNPPRDVIVAVCCSRQRAERYVSTEQHPGKQMRIVVEALLH